MYTGHFLYILMLLGHIKEQILFFYMSQEHEHKDFERSFEVRINLKSRVQ